MPTYVQPVSFSAQSLLAPDIAVQQQQAQRQSDLAAALRQMSLEPIDAGKGNIAWTQGAAKLAQALAGRIVQNRADKQQLTLAQAMAARFNGSKAYGYSDPPPAIGPQHTPAPPPSPISLPTAGTGLPPTNLRVSASTPPTQLGGASVRPDGLGNPPQPQFPLPAQPDRLAPLPDASSQLGAQPSQPPVDAQSPPQPPSIPQGGQMPQGTPAAPMPRGAFHPGALTLTGDPDRDRMLSVMYPEEYGKAVLASSAPVETARTIQQAQDAMARGDIATATALLQKIQHDNHMGLESVRAGAPFRNPETGEWGFAPKIGEGQAPQIDANGHVTSVGVIPGADTSARTMSAAEAGGKATVTPTTVLGNDGNFHTVPLTGVPGFGGGAPVPANAPPGGTGAVGNYYANRGGNGGGSAPANAGNVSGLGPGGQTAATTSGTNSANAYQTAIDAGQHARDAMRSLDLIMKNAQGLSTGTGAGLTSQLKSGFNQIADNTGVSSILNPIIGPTGYKVGFDRATIAKFDEMKKQASQLANQVSSGPGSTGTDARLNNAINSLPSSNYSPAAIQEVALNLRAQASRQRDFGIAAAKDMQTNGPGNYANFAGQWQKAYNPDIYYNMQKGPAAYQKWYQSLGSYAKSRVLDQYRALKAMGAFQ